MKNLNTEIIVIVDRSGSMGPLLESTISGFNSFLREQRALEGQARMTYVQFDDIVETVYQGRDIREAPELNTLNYSPRGSTALNDAIGQTLETQAKRITAEKWAELVIVQIITDGGENASKNYNPDRIKGMIQQSQNQGWTFLFQAANQDAFATARNYGFESKGVDNFKADAVSNAQAYGKFSGYVGGLRSMSLSAESTLADFDPAKKVAVKVSINKGS